MSETLANIKKAAGTSFNIVTLGSKAVTFDIKNHQELGQYYSELTNDNFFYKITDGGAWKYSGGPLNSYSNFGAIVQAPTISYNAETGILTCTRARVIAYVGDKSWYSDWANLTTTFYCVV